MDLAILHCPYDETLIVLIIGHCILLERHHSGNEPIDKVSAMDNLRIYIDGREVTLQLEADCTCLMLFRQAALGTTCWTCVPGMEKCFEVGVDEEACPCANGIVRK